MSKRREIEIKSEPDVLFERVVSILEQARGNVVRSVNSNMVVAYWLIGREIVQEVQAGAGRAEYGKQVVENLSAQLTERYGKGFSIANLKNFRQFYQVYADRIRILHPSGGEFADSTRYPPVGNEFASDTKLSPSGRGLTGTAIQSPLGSELPDGFSPSDKIRSVSWRGKNGCWLSSEKSSRRRGCFMD